MSERKDPTEPPEWIAARFSTVIRQFWQWHHGDFSRENAWSPPVNMYRMETRIDVCIDLAGVDPKAIEVRAEPERLIVRGTRAAPEPEPGERRPVRILAMEIDHGPFRRTIPMPTPVDVSRADTTYDAGLLWIRLPLKSSG